MQSRGDRWCKIEDASEAKTMFLPLVSLMIAIVFIKNCLRCLAAFEAPSFYSKHPGPYAISIAVHFAMANLNQVFW